MAFFPLIPQHPFIDYIGLAVLIAGIIIGALGSTISLKKFLKVWGAYFNEKFSYFVFIIMLFYH